MFFKLCGVFSIDKRRVSGGIQSVRVYIFFIPANRIRIKRRRYLLPSSNLNFEGDISSSLICSKQLNISAFLLVRNLDFSLKDEYFLDVLYRIVQLHNNVSPQYKWWMPQWMLGSVQWLIWGSTFLRYQFLDLQLNQSKPKYPADLQCHCYSMQQFDLKLDSCTFNLFYSNIPTVEKQIHTTLIWKSYKLHGFSMMRSNFRLKVDRWDEYGLIITEWEMM